jgi:hypothetical protein
MKQRDPKSLIPSLPVPAAPPPEALRGLIALGLDPTEATILLAHQLGFPQNYLAKAFGVSSTRVKTALNKATALGYGRLSRRDLLKRPRPIDEATRQKILEERNRLLDRIRRLERLTGLSDDPIL